jgi:hypothetical protein
VTAARRLALALVALAGLACSSGADPGGGGGSGGGSPGGAGGGAPVACVFSTTYTIVDGGGLVPMLDTATLSPPNGFRYQRRSYVSDAGQPLCEPAMPACGEPALVDVSDVEEVLAGPDVAQAFAETPLPTYGDRGVADGPSFLVTRPDGHGFNVGLACNTPSATCRPIPPGLLAARTLLRALITQQLADPACAGFATN